MDIEDKITSASEHQTPDWHQENPSFKVSPKVDRKEGEEQEMKPQRTVGVSPLVQHTWRRCTFLITSLLTCICLG